MTEITPPSSAEQSQILFSNDAGTKFEVVSPNNPLPVVQSSAPTGTQDINLKQVNGQTVNVGIGAAGTGTQRVSVSTDSVVVANPTVNTTVQTTALAANLVVHSGSSVLSHFQVSVDTTLSVGPWWVMVYNATSAPADGAVTPFQCYALPAGTTSMGIDFPEPPTLATGVVIGVSTTGPFTKTASTHAFISAAYR